MSGNAGVDPAGEPGADPAGNADTSEEPDTSGGEQSRRGLRNSLLWGVVGALSFLVLIQGYELLADDPVGLGPKFGVAVVVGLAAATTTRTLASRVPTENESP